MMMQSAVVNIVNADPGVIVDKLEGHPVHTSSSGTIDEKKESPIEEEHADYSISAQLQHQQHQQQQQHHHQHQHQHLQQQQQHYAHNPYAQHKYPPHVIAGMVPPQQVYIQQQQHQHQLHQLPLESQFQSMGLGDAGSSGGRDEHVGNDGGNNSSEDTNNGDGSNNENDDNNNNDGSDETNNEGGEQIANEEGDENESDEEPIKLFVGQVPKTMNEEDIFSTFDSFGPLKDVSIIRDKHTQLHRGCAFVTYWAASDAEQAQEALHGKHVFPGARRPAQVKPAEPSVPENKLFIGMLSRKAGEEEVRELFAPFGEIREIYMIRNADGTSKCAAFLRYIGRDSAITAIESLHNNLVMEGAARPLIVKFADNKHQRQQRHMRNVRRQELMTAVMGPPYPGGYPGPHMPMGPPPVGLAHQYPTHMGIHQHMTQFSAPYPGPGGGAQIYNPMAYPAPHHYGTSQPHPYGGFNRQQVPGGGRGDRHHQHQHHNDHGGGIPNNNQGNNPRPREGPAGANLFVYHLPHDLTDADLATAFNPFGNVISAKVYVDRYTGESKGFGFVSYDSVISAESAIEQMNGFQIGNKRLKVQHKRVHNNNGGNRGGGGQPPVMVPQEQHQHQHHQPYAHPYPQGVPLETPPDVGLDAGNAAIPAAEGLQAPISGGEAPVMMP
uniref:RRM domain-containing protein n=1 Tax=Pseudo-nitzschia australis TaxID=44445 RepID=A0A7S4AS97_9STRA|mmetsp:Transcript_27768/g.61166  ORF Transcript_27768/g.61166 Transcript_27768/m.61166 type:complete len:665 (+) Transcript_27768:194-2188(+)|eukprot:CAMPEP_0168178574 /NCGR_PEP_ID=MMETSP0139_2-20121125/9235_1 /TAXON_ID=44445 /ORGANISM="Pseudo-nitzschia australis, Strain 10249 10 AB" /LENGTH=664 /DNA_ID=CAMNT_0008098051 /DNA_START=113 /DNA_END=2107 /DNA_ORIENTATION=-